MKIQCENIVLCRQQTSSWAVNHVTTNFLTMMKQFPISRIKALANSFKCLTLDSFNMHNAWWLIHFQLIFLIKI